MSRTADREGFRVIQVDSIDGVTTLTLNRPERRNALNQELVDELAAALVTADEDQATRVIVLTGAGKTFCAGGDLGDVGREKSSAQQKDFVMRHVFSIGRALASTDKPVIAAINGPAVGAGFDLALMCDIRFAAEEAFVQEAYVRVGVPPGDGGAWLLPRIVGVAKALDLLWTGRRLRAQQALEMGLVDRISPRESLIWDTQQYAQELARGPQVAIRMIKRMVYQGLTMDLTAHIDQVSSHMAIIRESADFQEGLDAFREKRLPRFG